MMFQPSAIKPYWIQSTWSIISESLFKYEWNLLTCWHCKPLRNQKHLERETLSPLYACYIMLHSKVNANLESLALLIHWRTICSHISDIRMKCSGTTGRSLWRTFIIGTLQSSMIILQDCLFKSISGNANAMENMTRPFWSRFTCRATFTLCLTQWTHITSHDPTSNKSAELSSQGFSCWSDSGGSMVPTKTRDIFSRSPVMGCMSDLLANALKEITISSCHRVKASLAELFKWICLCLQKSFPAGTEAGPDALLALHSRKTEVGPESAASSV